MIICNCKLYNKCNCMRHLAHKRNKNGIIIKLNRFLRLICGKMRQIHTYVQCALFGVVKKEGERKRDKNEEKTIHFSDTKKIVYVLNVQVTTCLIRKIRRICIFVSNSNWLEYVAWKDTSHSAKKHTEPNNNETLEIKQFIPHYFIISDIFIYILWVDKVFFSHSAYYMCPL